MKIYVRTISPVNKCNFHFPLYSFVGFSMVTIMHQHQRQWPFVFQLFFVARLTKNNYNNCILPAHDGQITRTMPCCQVSSRVVSSGAPRLPAPAPAHVLFKSTDAYFGSQIVTRLELGGKRK